MAMTAFILFLLASSVFAFPTPQQTGLPTWILSRIGLILGPQLSSSSSIFGPSDPRWEDTTGRYDAHTVPHIRLVVRSGTEEDVPIIVRYANKYRIPFYAVNTGHGSTTSQTAFDGIQIDLSILTSVRISPGGETAWIQGGSTVEVTLDELCGQGYVTTTGGAGCPGILGVGLGGGHGLLQGFHGLVSDNFVTLNMVLANGRAITISESSYPDLFWAMRGAGHNFGIVTSAEMRVYPRPERDWSFKLYIWAQDKIEPVFDELVRMREDGEPSDLAFNFGSEPIFLWSFVWAGPLSEAQPYLAPFDAIPVLITQNGSAPYNLIPRVTGTGVDSTHYLQQWNNITTNPTAFERAAVLMGDYKHDAVAQVDAASSAFPWRDRHLLNNVAIKYTLDPSLDDFALTWARRTKELWDEGQPGVPGANYSVYGYEPWRMQRLKALKLKHDPLGRFSYYNPIPIRRGI
ncbi:hypothetical protein BJX62DRAFT_230567 [Aspergillus germanicus]